MNPDMMKPVGVRSINRVPTSRAVISVANIVSYIITQQVTGDNWESTEICKKIGKCIEILQNWLDGEDFEVGKAALAAGC